MRAVIKRGKLKIPVDRQEGYQHVKVIIHPLSINHVHDSYNTTILLADFLSFVCLCNFAGRRDSAPIPQLIVCSAPSNGPNKITYKCMPDSDMLDIWMVFSNLCHCMLQSFREAFFVGFEICHSSSGLNLTVVILPRLSSNHLRLG